jgi:hypothetical protein
MAPSASWCRKYSAARCPVEKTDLILNCGEYLTCDARVRLSTAIVGKWVDAIRYGHPTYAPYIKGKGLKACMAVYNSLRPGEVHA